MSTHGRAYRAGLERFRWGRAGREESREVVRHLLEACSECRTATSKIWPAVASGSNAEAAPSEPGTGRGEHDYSKAFARADKALAHHQLQLSEEQAAVARLRRELARHPKSRQEVLAANSSRYHLWAMVESLLDDCRPLCKSDPEEATHLARLATRLVERLDPERYGEARIRDLQARAWAELANGLRLQERYRESERAFAKAYELLQGGTGDPLEKAGVLSLEASLWSNRFEFPRAIALVDRTITIARRLGEGSLLARALTKKAKYNIDRGLPEHALPLLLEAQKHVDPALDPRLTAIVQHNVLYALVEAGRYEEAAAGFDGTRGLYGNIDYPVDRIRLDWLEGRVFRGLGRLKEAELCLRQAFDGMLAEGLDFHAAIVGLDLAALYSQQNRNLEIRELASAMLPVFTSQRIHREALAALLFFREAVARERLSSDLAQELAEYLRRAVSQPHLRFHPPPGLATGS